MSNRPLVIGLSGCSASGKTTLSQWMVQYLQEKGRTTLVISQDDYFLPQWINEELQGNWDHPSAVDHFSLCSRLHEAIYTNEADVIILEGFMAFFDIPVAGMCDIKFWIDIDAVTASSRRADREFNWMSKTRYLKEVWPNHLKYIDFVKKSQFPGLAAPICLDGKERMEPVVREYLDLYLK